MLYFSHQGITSSRVLEAASVIVHRCHNLAMLTTLSTEEPTSCMVLVRFSPWMESCIVTTKSENLKAQRFHERNQVLLIFADDEGEGCLVCHAEVDVIDDPDQRQTRWMQHFPPGSVTEMSGMDMFPEGANRDDWCLPLFLTINQMELVDQDLLSLPSADQRHAWKPLVLHKETRSGLKFSLELIPDNSRVMMVTSEHGVQSILSEAQWNMEELACHILHCYDHCNLDYDVFSVGRIGRTMSKADAYEVQNAVASLRMARGEKVAGFKLGMTSPRIKQQTGITGPVRGYIWQNEVHLTNAHIQSNFANLGLESEIAVRLGKPVYPGMELHELVDAIEAWHVCIELHDVVFQESPSIQQLLCCNAINAGVILSEPCYDINLLHPNGPEIPCRLFLDELKVEDAPFREVPGGLAGSLGWLAESLRSNPAVDSRNLLPGDIILLGCPGKLIVPEKRPTSVRAECSIKCFHMVAQASMATTFQS